MLTFHKLRYKNFLSSGNKFLEIILDNSNVTIVTGKNGDGKSSIIYALFYGLYGKSFSKVNQGSLINSINKKQLLVEIEFTQNNDKYLIRRGLKPNVFEIYKNDKLVPITANVKDYQQWLVSNVLKMDEKTFRQIIIMGSTTYVPFMKLTAYERRTVIEDILSIDIFSAMNDIAKERNSILQSEIDKLQSEEQKYKWKLDGLKSNMDTIASQIAEKQNELKKKIHSVKTSITNAKQELDNIMEQANKYDASDDVAKMETVVRQISQLNTLLAKKEHISEGHIKTLDFFKNNNICPQCTQTLPEELIVAKTHEYEACIQKDVDDLEQFHTTIKELTDKHHEYSQRIKEYNKLIKEHSKKRAEYENLKNTFNIYYNEYEASKHQTNALSSVNNDEILDCEKNIQQIQMVQETKSHDADNYNTIIQLLKDTGIKSVIIKNYLTSINTLMKKYLSIIGFNVSFEFDEQFNETIKSRNRDVFEYGSFSEGEKLRIDFCLLFTFRELARLRASVHTNLLMIDEMDGRLDNTGIDAVSQLFLNTDGETNIFIISQYPEQFMEISNRQITATKINNFTSLSEHISN